MRLPKQWSQDQEKGDIVRLLKCIYGLRQFGIEDQGWVAWFCIAALLNKPITIFGDGKQVRDLLWVDDLVSLYEATLENIDKATGNVFNTGGGPDNVLCPNELISWLQTNLNGKLNLRFAPERAGDQKVFISNNCKSQSLLGWQPTTPVDSGLSQLLDWTKSNLDDIRRLQY